MANNSNPTYIDSMDIFGYHIKQIPCIVREGPPTDTTKGAVGMLYMDSSNNGEMYKCIEVNDTSYTWVKLISEDSSNESHHDKNIYYIATDYGISTEAEDNTAAMQALIDMVHANGGGIIWMPIGTYKFNAENSIALTDNIQTCLVDKSGVSIIGESITETVIKVYGNTAEGASWIASQSDNVSIGCSYQNFTVDMSEESMNIYTHKGKAFYISGIKDCVFRDLRLLNTPSTSLGIDMLDNVVIDSIYIYRGGREWITGAPGGAGIGIGTGKWLNENYIIRNCICVSCGHFGIFLEDQGLFESQPVRNYSKGQIITNNIVRNGRNYGIGVRGGKNVIITGNNLYENHGGFYLDYGAKNVMITGNVVTDSAEAAVLFGIEDIRSGFDSFKCENIIIAGNSFIENAEDVLTLRDPINSQIANNYTFGSGNIPTRIILSSSDLSDGIKLMPDGSETTQDGGLTTDYLNVDSMGARIRITTVGTTDSIRIAQYDENKNSLVTDAGLDSIYDGSTHELIIEKLDGCVYIRLFYTPRSDAAAVIQSIIIEGIITPVITLSSTDLMQNIKINPDGGESNDADALSTDYLDVSDIDGNIKITTTTNGSGSSVRVAQYDADKISLVTNAVLHNPSGSSPYELEIEKLDGCAYIRVFYAPVDTGVPVDIQSIVVEQS